MKSKRDGFSLLEVMLALVLFTVGIMFLMNALNIGIFSNTDIENTTLASNIAQAKMETIRSLPFSSLVSSNPNFTAGKDGNFSTFYVTPTLSGSDPTHQLRIDITVTWNNGNTKIQLTTLRTNG